MDKQLSFFAMVFTATAGQNLIDSAVTTSSMPVQDENAVDYPLSNVYDKKVSYIPNGLNDALYLFRTESGPPFVSFDFGASKTINTLYIGFNEQNDFVRSMTVSVDSQLCWQNTETGMPMSQFITCPQLQGWSLNLQNSGIDSYSGVAVSEVMAFEDFLITPIAAVASSSYGSVSVLTTLEKQASLTSASRTTCFSTDDVDLSPSITYTLPSTLAISSVVFIPLPLPDSSVDNISSNVLISVADLSSSSSCGLFQNDPLIPCFDLNGNQVILSRWTTFAVCQVGILVSADTYCTCANTLFDATSLGTNYVDVASLITGSSSGTLTAGTYIIGQTPLVFAIYDISLLTNSVSVACSIDCGQNEFVLYDYDTGQEVDVTGASINYNALTRELTFDTSDPSYEGTHNYGVKVKLNGFTEYFPQSTDFTVTALITCSQDTDLSGIQAYYSPGVPMTGSPPYGAAYYHAYYNIDGTNTTIEIPFSFGNFPTCDGYSDFTYFATITNSTTEVPISTNETEFATCLSQNSAASYKVQTCLFLDIINQKLSFYFQDEFFVGINTYKIYTTASANGGLLTWTQISGENTIEVRSCVGLSFSPFEFQSSYFDTSISPLQVNLNDDDSIFFYAQTGMTATELLNYCGPLTFSLFAVEYTNTNYDMTLKLMDCTLSCVQLTQPTDGTFDVGISILESKYSGFVGCFWIKVQFQMYDKNYYPQVNKQRLSWPYRTQSLYLNVTNTEPCVFTDLQGVKFYNSTNSPFFSLENLFPISSQAYRYRITQKTLTMKNAPTCIGFKPMLTTFKAYMTLQNGTVVQALTSETEWATCQSQPLASCFYFKVVDYYSVIVHWYQFDESFRGTNTYTIETFLSADINGVIETAQYDVTYGYDLMSCGVVQFSPLAYITDDFAVPFDDQSSLDIDLNNQLKSVKYLISDSEWDATGVFSCYWAIFKLEVHPSETNSLASQLLACSLSCLKVEIDPAGIHHRTFTTSLLVNETQYVNLTLKFRVTFSYDRYYNLQPIPFTTQPVKQINFDVVIGDDPSCEKIEDINTMELYNSTGGVVNGNVIVVKAFAPLNSTVITIANEPTCVGYLPPVFTFQIKGLHKQMTVNSDYAVFQQCLINGNSSCFYINIAGTTITFSYQVQADWAGENKLIIGTTLYGSNQLGYQISQQYSWEIDLFVSDCGSTQFVMPHDPQIVAIVNTFTPPVQILIQDQVGLYQNDQMFCGERMVTISTNNPLGQSLLSSESLTFTVDKEYVYLTLSNLDEKYQLQEIDFAMFVYLKEYYPSGFPDMKFVFNITILPSECQHVTAIFSPNHVTIITYKIGTILAPQQYKLVFNHDCNFFGVLKVLVNSVEVDPLPYGLQINSESNYRSLNVVLSCNYLKSDVDFFVIELVYTLRDRDYSFSPIYVEYLSQAKYPPFFAAELSKPSVVDCNNFDSWSYQLPKAQDPLNKPVRYNWECQAKAIKFTQQGLTLDPNLPLVPGEFFCTVILSNPSLAFNIYTIPIKIQCLKSPKIGENSTTQVPIPRISSVSREGLVMIQWSTPMSQTNLSEAKGEGIVHRKLSEQIILVEYNQYTKYNLPYSYQFYWVNSRMTALQLYFKDPQYVSADSKVHDSLNVIFVTTNLFTSDKGHPVDLNTTLITPMPKQVGQQSINIDKEQLQEGMIAFMGTSFVLSFILSAIINQLLQFIANLVFIVHFFILFLNYPANVQDFIQALFPLVVFDILPTEYLYTQMFQLDQISDSPVNQQFDMVGYGGTLIVPNLGSQYIIFVIVVGITLILTICFRCIEVCCFRSIRARVAKFLNYFYWNGLISMLDQNYLFLCFSAMIQLTDLRFKESKSEYYNSLLGITIIVVLLMFPIAISILYWVKLKSVNPLPDLHDRMQLEDLQAIYGTIDITVINQSYTETKHRQFMQRYGCLLKDINLRSVGKTKAIMTAILPCVKCLVFSACIMATIDYPVLAIMLLNQLLILCYALSTKQSLFSYCVMLGVIYHLYYFTEYADIDEQIAVGNYVISFISVQSLIVFVMAFRPVCVQASLKWRRFKHLRRMRNKRRNKKKASHIQVQSSATIMIDDIVVQNMEDKVIPKTEDIVIPKMEAFQVEEISEQEKLRIEYERMRSRMQKAIERRKRRSLKEEWEKLHNSRYNKKPSQEEQIQVVQQELARIESLGSQEEEKSD